MTSRRWFAGLMVLCLSLACATAALGAARAPAAPAAAAPTLEDAFKALPTHEFGQSREGLTVIADALRDSYKDPAARAKLTARLTAVLASSATADAKRFVCRQLSIVGTAREVPALAALLTDKDLSDIARYAVERIADPAAVEALRAALPKATPKQKVGIVNSLGERHDAGSVAAMAALLKETDVSLASAAAAALGKIGGPEAVSALAAARAGAPPEVKAVISDAYMLCADRLLADKKNDEAAAIYQEMFKPAEPKHVRTAALRGIVAAGGEKTMPLLTELLTGTDKEMQAAVLRFLREVAGPGTAKSLVTLLPKLPPATQALLLDDMATRGDPAALPAVLSAAQSQDEAVKLAAVRAMGRLGDASALPVLTPLATGAGGLADEAKRSIDRLPGTDVNPALLALADKGDAKVRPIALASLGTRRVTAAVPVALKAAEDADPAVRLAAIQALDLLVDEKSAAAMVGLVAKAKADPEREAAEKALGSLCGRAANKDACVEPILAAIPATAMPAKGSLIRALGRAGGTKALGAIRGLVKDADATVQDAAIRSLADWADPAAAADLLALAKGEGRTAVLALRGYVRLAGTEAVAPAAKLKMYQEAMAAAKQPAEKKSVLGGLGNLKDVEALRMVAPCIDDEALRQEASAAAVKIAKALGKTGADDIKAAMQKVIGASKDANTVKEAEGILKALGGAPAPKKGKAAAEPVQLKIYAAPLAGAKAADAGALKLGWRIGCQAYSFNRFTFAEAAEKTASVGCKYIEIYPGQKLSKDKPNVKTSHDMSDADIAEMKQIAAAAGLKIVNYGVVGLGKDEAGARKVFDFARKVGLETIVTEAAEDALPMLDKLCAEYSVNIALHNHPKPSHYWSPDTVLKAVEGRSKRIGSDADTGHWVRSGLNPLECLKKLEGRIVSLHFKDLKDGHDVPWGTGNSDAKAMLAELARQGFKGVFSIEYEYNWDNSVPEIAKCVEFFYATAADLAKGPAK